jgi:hypothetical protein
MNSDTLILLAILAAAGFAAYELEQTVSNPGTWIAGGAVALLLLA